MVSFGDGEQVSLWNIAVGDVLSMSISMYVNALYDECNYVCNEE